MPDITITVSPALAQRINGKAALYNEAHGTSLSGKQWVIQVLKEAMTDEDMEGEDRTLAAQFDAARRARRQALIDAL